jgi:uncharacterized membrane protein YhdT
MVALSLLVVAGSDKWMWLLSAIAGGLSIGGAGLPAWFATGSLALAFVAIVMRVTYLTWQRSDELLVTLAWRYALQVAGRRCPTKMKRNVSLPCTCIDSR